MRDVERNRRRNIWRAIVHRCTNPRDRNFKRYGARGIGILPAWRDDFDAFDTWVSETLGARPSADHQLDRIDNNGSYVPGNLRWGTRAEQARNRRDTVYLTHDGETLPLATWADRLGISYKLLHERRGYGWSDSKILTTPVAPKSSRRAR